MAAGGYVFFDGGAKNLSLFGVCAWCGERWYRFKQHECKRPREAHERTQIVGYLRACLRRNGGEPIPPDEVHVWLDRVMQLEHRAPLSKWP